LLENIQVSGQVRVGQMAEAGGGAAAPAGRGFVAYYRVSTASQGRSGLGLEAQQAAVAAFLRGVAPLAAMTEVESGKNNGRPKLGEALALCRLTGATLVVAKLDRLARNARFLLSVVEGSSEGGVVFCDLPSVPAGPVGRFLITQMAAVAELEAGLIAQRTRVALAASKARGATLGGWRGGPKVDTEAGMKARQDKADAYAAAVGPLVAEMQGRGLSLRVIAAELSARGIRTPRDGAWSAAAVRAVALRAGPGPAEAA
jgi:DNA invertase Pin-like site-specific DNA recombinase